jgi:hypothetical protein
MCTTLSCAWDKWLLVLSENGLHLKAELPGPFNYLLHGFKTTPESFFSCWVKSTFALRRVNPAKLIAVLAAVCRCLREPADRFGHQTQHGRRMSLAVDLAVDLAPFVLKHFCSGFNAAQKRCSL